MGLGRETGLHPLSPLALYPRRGSPKAGGEVFAFRPWPGILGNARPRRRGAGCAAPSGDSWRILDGFCESPAKPRPVWVFQIGAGGVTVGVGWSYRGGWVELPWGLGGVKQGVTHTRTRSRCPSARRFPAQWLRYRSALLSRSGNASQSA